MSTYRELVYMALDEVKGQSDDFNYNEDHIIFLLDKYRALIIKQRYSDLKKEIPESAYQTLCLDLIEVPAISGLPCEGGSYLRSKNKIPFILPIGSPTVYPIDYYQSAFIQLVSRERMRFVGDNKYLQNIIYCSIGPDGYLYFNSSNPQFIYLQKVRFTAIFENTKEAAENTCEEDSSVCDALDKEFPLEEAYIPAVMELVLKELLGVAYRPKDTNNNAHDDLGDVATKQQSK